MSSQRLLRQLSLLLPATALLLIAADHAPPQQTLKTYPLPGYLDAADISPDETRVAVLASATFNSPSREGAVQIWDFKAGKAVAETPLLWNSAAGVPQIRYSARGDLIVACVGRKLHVFRTEDLKELEQIAIPDEIATVKSKVWSRQSMQHTHVSNLELSPTMNLAAVLTRHLVLGNRIEVFNLDTGAKTQSWKLTDMFAAEPAQAWHPDGRRIFIVTGEGGENRREIAEFDATNGTHVSVLSVDMPVASIADTR